MKARKQECRGGVCPPLTEGTNAGAKNFSPSRRLGCDDIQTSFSPNFNNKTTSVAEKWEYHQPHYLINLINKLSVIKQWKNEVMRLLGVCYLRATEVVLSGKSGRNEVSYCTTTINHNNYINHINQSSDRISMKARKQECRGGVCPPLTEGTNVGAKNFSPLTENAKGQKEQTTSSLRGRSPKQSRAFAKTQSFFLDCFVAALLAMTRHLLPLRNFSRSYISFSIFNWKSFQLSKSSIHNS
jgi:hypothetical protein